MSSPLLARVFYSGSFRDFVLPLLAFALVALLPQSVSRDIMIIGGQAHFALAYLYQFRAGRMRAPYFFGAFLLLAVAAWFFLLTDAPFIPLFTVASLVFGLHFVMDEVPLHGESWSTTNLGTAIGFFLLFSAIVLQVPFPELSLLPWIVAAALVPLALIRLAASRARLGRAERYLWFVLALLFLFSQLVPAVLMPGVTMLIIWLHYANWMLAYGKRVAPDPARSRRYWADTVLVTGACIALGVAFVSTGSPLLGFFFGHMAFHAWAIAHITLSSPIFSGARRGYA